MKSLKPIIICAAIVVLVALVLVIFKFAAPNTPDETPEANDNPVIESSGSSVYIIEKNYEDLTTMEFLPSDEEHGKQFKVDIHVTEEGNYEYQVTPATDKFDYNTSLFRSLMYTVSKVSAKNEITEDVRALSDYGLDTPWYTVRCTYKDGAVVELYFGNKTVVDNNYYCKTNLSDSVYIIGSYSVQLMTRDELQYRDATLFPTYENDDIYENISWIRMTLRDGTVLEVERDYDSDDEVNVIGSMYVMRSPYVGSVNDEIFRTEVMDIVAPIKQVEIVKDITEAEYAEYGFDNPVRLEMEAINGQSLNLLIGKVCANETYTYAMIDGTDTLLIVESSCLTWQTAKPMELFIRVGWLYNITDIAKYEFEFKTEKFASLYAELEPHYTVEMTHGSYINDAGNKINTIDGTLNGEPILEANCRRLYIRMLNMRVIDKIPEDADLSVAPDVTFTITKIDGTVSVMKLIPINDRDYAMQIDGEATYYVYQKNLNNLIKGLKENAMGFELENVFSAY